MTDWAVLDGEVLDRLRELPSCSFDGLLSDVPYGLGNREPGAEEISAYVLGQAGIDMGGDFMSKDWEIPSVAVWREVHRVLKPGAHLLVFAGSRTQDLVTIGIRSTGFEIRDCIMWHYVSGMPKSLRTERVVSMATCRLAGRHFWSKLPNEKDREPADHVCPTTQEGSLWDGTGSGLKPSYEPIVLARKPIEGTVAANVQKYGTAALAIDTCRVGYASESDHASMAEGVDAIRERGGTMGNSWKNSSDLSGANQASPLGRWPANTILSHAPDCIPVGSRKVRTGTAKRSKSGGKNFGSDTPKPPLQDMTYADANGQESVEAWHCVPDCPVRIFDDQSGDRPGMSGGGKHREGYAGGMFGGIDSAATARGDAGGASRVFFCAKASRAEREFGCDGLPERSGAEAVERVPDTAGVNNPRAGAGRTAEKVRNHGPCVKPISLTKYLATLILPPAHCAPRRLLVPYCGTGSEMIGAIRAGWEHVTGIERDPEYAPIARARIARWLEVSPDLDESDVPQASNASSPLDGQKTLFV